MDLEKLLDATGRKLLAALQTNARLSFSELGRQVGLSQPAVAERVKRFEAEGLITGYHAAVDPGKLGRPIQAYVRLITPPEKYARFLKLIATWPEVLECHHVSGDDSFVLKIAVASTAHLEEFIGRFTAFGPTKTAIILSSPLAQRILE
jgi:Lrp/AsnC family leucine-responsive transcriptional regulator